jgi:hypothetical protein
MKINRNTFEIGKLIALCSLFISCPQCFGKFSVDPAKPETVLKYLEQRGDKAKLLKVTPSEFRWEGHLVTISKCWLDDLGSSDKRVRFFLFIDDQPEFIPYDEKARAAKDIDFKEFSLSNQKSVSTAIGETDLNGTLNSAKGRFPLREIDLRDPVTRNLLLTVNTAVNKRKRNPDKGYVENSAPKIEFRLIE